MKKVLNGFLALLITGGVLLFSDRNNRVDPTSQKSKDKTQSDITATKGRQYRVGLTYVGPDQSLDLTLDGLWEGIKELGYVKDSNLTVIAQHANGEIANLQPIHLNMDNQDVDLIIVTSTPGITAAISTVKKHPMVFTMTYKPLEAGAGKSSTDHRPNITGVGSFPPIEKTFDFIHESFPKAKRVGTLYNSSEANSRKVAETARIYTPKKGLELIESTVTNTSEVYQSITSLCNRNIDAVWITGDNTALQAFHTIVKVCQKHKTPLIINDIEYIDQGALAAIGVDWFQTGLRTASYVAKVLNGATPSKIPIENYVKEDIAINTELANKMGIEIPEKYLNFKYNELKGKDYKFCLAHYIHSTNSENAERGIRDKLKESGLIEGIDFTLKTFNAQGDISTLNSISDAIASEKWDLVFVTSTPTIQAISKKINNSPIVFTNVGDPISCGLGKSFEDHMPNMTGISTMSDFERMIEMVIESIPGIKTIGTVYTPGESNSVAYKEALEKEANKKRLTLIAVPANSATEVADAALSLTNRGIEAFTQLSDNLTASCGASIIKEAYKSKIPYFAFISNQVKQGAVAAVARDYYFAGVDAVTMALDILKGKSPRDIPFRYVDKTSVSVNTEAIEYFNIEIPKKYYQQ